MGIGKGKSSSFFVRRFYINMKKILLLIAVVLFASAFPVKAEQKKDGRFWQDELVYSIMIDRFNNADISNDYDVDVKNPEAYNGGDLQGIIDKLDYIHNMGFTTIRLTPIFDNTKGGYHGYWVQDYYKVDEHFGTLNTFKQLVKEAHKRGLKVIIDFVVVNKNGMNLEESQANEFIDAAIWWINETDIDGYSLPEFNRVPLSFWSNFSKAVKGEKNDFFLMGISSENTAIDKEKYREAGIDSIFDYSYSENLRKVFANTNRSFSTLGSYSENGAHAYVTANFFDNEFTSRFTKDIVEERQFPGSRWKTALTYLYTTPGIPVIYYGTEIALNGGEIPDNRRLMNFRAEKELIDYMTKLGELRNKLLSLTRGTMEVLYDQNGMAVYKRKYKGETTVIAINNTRETQKVTLTAEQLEKGKELRGLLAGDLVRSKNDEYILVIERDESEIYVLADKSGLNIPFILAVVISSLLILLFLILIIKRGKRNRVE